MAATTTNCSPREAFKKRKSQSLKSAVPLAVQHVPENNDITSIGYTKSLSLKHGGKRMLKRDLSRSLSTADVEDLMFNAVMREDIETLKNCLADDEVRIDHISTNGYTALHQACEIGSLEIVTLLVDAGADLFVKTINKESPLQISTKNGQFEIAEFLISIGAKDNEIKDGVSKTHR